VQDKVGLPSSQASRTRFSKDSKIQCLFTDSWRHAVLCRSTAC